MNNILSLPVGIKDFLFRISLILIAIMVASGNVELLTQYWKLAPSISNAYFAFVVILMMIGIVKAVLFILFYFSISKNLFYISLVVLVFEIGIVIVGPSSKVPLHNLVGFYFFSSLLLVIAWKWLECLAPELALAAQKEASIIEFESQKKRNNINIDKPNSESTEQIIPLIRYKAKNSSVSFKDIFGMTDFKNRFTKEMYQFSLNNSGISNKFSRNGILLFGEPGNGKTFFAESIAGELKLPIISVSYGDIASRWINNTTENLMQLFHEAKQQAPCVLFFDEIDSLISDRSLQSSSDETQKTTNAFLTEIVNLRKHSVLFIGATNFFDQLDQAAIREGRFDFKFEVKPPDEKARYELLTQSISHYFNIQKMNTIVFQQFSAQCEGFSVKRLQSIGRELKAIFDESPFENISHNELKVALRRLQGSNGFLPEATLNLDDLYLNRGLKEQLESIVYRLKLYEHMKHLGGTIPTGLLFYGNPSTGKTETAKALAKESNFAFICTTGNELISDASTIDRLMKKAMDIRPCIIFIDEADDVLAIRRMSHVASVTSKLLIAMEKASGNSNNVVFIAATNHPDLIDSAALRGGRFSEKVHFTLPSKEILLEFVKNYIDYSRACFDENLSYEDILKYFAEDTSIADAKAIMQEATNQMIFRSLEDKFNLVFEEDIQKAAGIVRGDTFIEI